MTSTPTTTNPTCYGCGKPISDELLAYVKAELLAEGEDVEIENASLICEACGGYTVAEALAAEAFGSVDTDTCPEHGEQVVKGYGATIGPDPYSVQHLACGHKVICLGPGESNIII